MLHCHKAGTSGNKVRATENLKIGRSEIPASIGYQLWESPRRRTFIDERDARSRGSIRASVRNRAR